MSEKVGSEEVRSEKPTENVAQTPWQQQQGPLETRWASKVTPETVHPEYPRPQLVREPWQNLNGLWEYALRDPGDDTPPQSYDGAILVPFPLESALSGVMQRSEGRVLWYRRSFRVPEAWRGGRVLLHFGAVDWEAKIWLNGTELGSHQGGYDPFSFDLTEALTDDSRQELVVRVWDPTDDGVQPFGKQSHQQQAIWYTPITGIWQTVWLEPVPESFIERLLPVPKLDAGVLELTVQGGGQADSTLRVRAVASDAGEPVAEVAGAVGETLELALPDAKRWSPDDPFLYDLEVTLLAGERVIDRVTSYFGMRKIALGQDEQGHTRLFLNDAPLFQYGPLDQGFWPDGLYAPPSDEALRYDLEVTRDLGFNMVRKHVKVESARWYYHADRLGLLVWQDMPNGDARIGRGEGEISRTPESAAQYELELERLLDALHPFPCIVMWVPFNEGWGQFDTARVAAWVKGHDPSRLVNSVSGWNDVGAGDTHDLHAYPGPVSPPTELGRAAVLGEFGGLGLPLAGHTWQSEANWGYRTYDTEAALTEAYLALLQELGPLVSAGLAAAVYTQTTDVEIEVNGLMTYDRAVLKVPLETLKQAHAALYRAQEDTAPQGR